METKKGNKNFQTKVLIDQILDLLHDSFNGKGKKLEYSEITDFLEDLNGLLEMYSNYDALKCSVLIRKRYLSLLKILMKVDFEEKRQAVYLRELENAYRLSGKRDLASFIIYYEWDFSTKMFEKRYTILQPYAYYLNKMCFDPEFELLIANLPSGWGKSRMVKYYEAFRLGVESSGTFLSLCSNDTVVKGGSRSVIDIIKSERYGKVFNELNYLVDKEIFLKETDGEWKIKQCGMMASYYASTTNSNVVGQRASLSVNIDDLYADYLEAMREETNEYYFNKYLTVWKERFVQDKVPQVIITGTLWSPSDFIAKVIELTENESEFIPHPKFRYTKISKDGKKVIIQVPAMDEDFNVSSCEQLISTEKLLAKKNSMPTYLWETNFQQKPTAPEGLEFDYQNLKLYKELPKELDEYSYAVIDGTRKSGKDYFSMPIFRNSNYEEKKYAFYDCIFTKRATSELYDEIVDKIIECNIVKLVIETNVDGGLKKILEERLEARGHFGCVIVEKYNTVTKSVRIEAEKGKIKKYIEFPQRGYFAGNSDMNQFMNNLVRYNSKGRNINDDAPDSLGMFTAEIVDPFKKKAETKAIKRPF